MGGKRINEEFHRQKLWSLAVDHLGGECVRCGETENLQFDHVDPATKLFDIGANLTYAHDNQRFWVEVAKCQLLCTPHHREKSKEEQRLNYLGMGNPNRKLVESDVRQIRWDVASGMDRTDVGNKFNITRQHVGRIVNRRLWKDVI